MKVFICVAVVVAIAALTVSANYFNDPIFIENQFELVQPDLEPEFKYNLPKVHGAKSCGGEGKLLSIRVKSCSPDKICRLAAQGKARPWEVEFIPSVDSEAIGLRVNLLVDGSAKMVYERAIADSKIEAGKKLVFRSTGGAFNELQGKTLTSQVILYRVDDNNVEVCAESTYELY